MSLDVVPVTAGSAHAALAEAVSAAKHGEVLRPVTVLVPTNAAGVIARRTLGRLGGVAAVDFLTLGRLAERLYGFELQMGPFAVAELRAADLLKKAAKIEKGSGKPNREKIGTITRAQIEEIAKTKLPDLNTANLEAAIRTVEGTAKSLGLEIK